MILDFKIYSNDKFKRRRNYHDYSPNELARLSISNPEKYTEVVSGNLDKGDTVEKWEQRNLEFMMKLKWK